MPVAKVHQRTVAALDHPSTKQCAGHPPFLAMPTSKRKSKERFGSSSLLAAGEKIMFRIFITVVLRAEE
jgi:hypothetical protein